MAAKHGISGFDAKSSFNTAFKKDTGMTPTGFRNNKNYKKDLTVF
jgi:AraC-like DNA-binding protein